VSKRDDIKKQIEDQQNEVYGENTASGSAPDPGQAIDDVEEIFTDEESESTINPGDEFHMADDVIEEETPPPTHHTEEADSEDEEDDNLIK